METVGNKMEKIELVKATKTDDGIVNIRTVPKCTKFI